MLDESLVEAAQTIRALEDGDEEDFYPIEPSAPSPPPPTRQIAAPPKRARIGNGAAEAEAEEGPASKKRSNGGGIGGLLSEDAMENLKFYADMAKKQAEEARTRTQKKAPPTGMALLGGYGSGDDSD